VSRPMERQPVGIRLIGEDPAEIQRWVNFLGENTTVHSSSGGKRTADGKAIIWWVQAELRDKPAPASQEHPRNQRDTAVTKPPRRNHTPPDREPEDLQDKLAALRGRYTAEWERRR
jgi:hypothetical protein